MAPRWGHGTRSPVGCWEERQAPGSFPSAGGAALGGWRVWAGWAELGASLHLKKRFLSVAGHRHSRDCGA